MKTSHLFAPPLGGLQISILNPLYHAIPPDGQHGCHIVCGQLVLYQQDNSEPSFLASVWQLRGLQALPRHRTHPLIDGRFLSLSVRSRVALSWQKSTLVQYKGQIPQILAYHRVENS